MHGQRGATLIEVMIATCILVIATTGFIGVMQTSATANGTAHRRTVGALLRKDMLDRLAVTRRPLPAGLTQGAWLVDACYDVQSAPMASNPGWDPDFTCPLGTYYQRWINVRPVADPDPTRGATGYDIALYVERVDRGCTPETRYSSLGCVAADMLLTD
jgi:type II secretory pathway pseudopilin PulG